jgi:hypothetical protein
MRVLVNLVGRTGALSRVDRAGSSPLDSPDGICATEARQYHPTGWRRAIT